MFEIEKFKKNNLLIYEFMDECMDIIYHPILNKYHFDWDLLMNVVEKIESLDYRVTINFANCYIEKYDETGEIEEEEEVASCYGDTKLQSVYNAVVEFVKYYKTVSK